MSERERKGKRQIKCLFMCEKRCVCMLRERERERESEQERDRDTETQKQRERRKFQNSNCLHACDN